MLTCGCRPTAYVVIFVIKLYPHPFAVACGHSTAAAPAQGDRDNTVDVGQHDGHADAYRTYIYSTFLKAPGRQEWTLTCFGPISKAQMSH